MAMSNTSAPARIHAKVHGFRTTIPGGSPRLCGGWDEDPDIGRTEYIRADLVSGLLDALSGAADRLENEGLTATFERQTAAAIAKAEGRALPLHEGSGS